MLPIKPSQLERDQGRNIPHALLVLLNQMIVEYWDGQQDIQKRGFTFVDYHYDLVHDAYNPWNWSIEFAGQEIEQDRCYIPMGRRLIFKPKK